MDLGVVAALLLPGALLVAMVNAAGRGGQLIGGLFAPPALGWPHGVQEDDDLAWAWPKAAGAEAAGADDDADQPWRVPLLPVRYVPRSAPRPTS